VLGFISERCSPPAGLPLNLFVTFAANVCTAEITPVRTKKELRHKKGTNLEST
jgi:hypothetical protein